MMHQIGLEVLEPGAHGHRLLGAAHEGLQLLGARHLILDDTLYRIAELGRMSRFKEHALLTVA